MWITTHTLYMYSVENAPDDLYSQRRGNGYRGNALSLRHGDSRDTTLLAMSTNIYGGDLGDNNGRCRCGRLGTRILAGLRPDILLFDTLERNYASQGL